MKTAFGTVVYEEAYKFHEDFISTINNQDAVDFDVLLLNDNLTERKYDTLTEKINRDILKIESSKDNTIPSNRVQLIKKAKEEKYDLLVLGDFDDIISKNRISRIISNFDFHYSFFYNELCYLNTEKKFFSFLPSEIKKINPILECNFLGLSNTALNLNQISFEILEVLKNKPTVAFDWMIFSVLLAKGHKGKKVGQCKTFYRIHNQNTAGEMDFNIVGLKKEIEIKTNHYSKLVDMDPIYIDLQKFYQGLNNSFEEYSELLIKNSIVNNYYWWGRIKKSIILKERQINANKK